MALIGTLVDQFGDSTVDSVLWPASYGGVAQDGTGRVQIDCDVTQWSGLRSAAVYTLAGSSVTVPVWPPAAGGASVAYLSVLVTTTTAGTSAGFNIDAATNGIAYLSQVGFSDSSAVFGGYDPVAHAWLRLSESGGTLTWETSPDGQTWTVRRTAASPGWVSATDLALLCESHRDAGTDDVAEVAGVNVPAVRTITGAGRAIAAATAAVATVRTTTGRAEATGTASAVVSTTRTITGAARAVAGATAAYATTRITAGVGRALATASAVVLSATVHRPNLGTTVRPSTGTTARPAAGITPRP